MPANRLVFGAGDVRDQACGASRVATQQHRGCFNAGHGRQCGLNLAQLDPMATQLDLFVSATEVFQAPVIAPAAQIAASVETPAVQFDEAFGG
ncbi:hypothetical protein LMG19145_03985 [Xanthomonas arboricola pv. fragariae]|nr:hypothetical protein LMG19145_03985 [Xanthomonas arboricola pv. fragariae]